MIRYTVFLTPKMTHQSHFGSHPLLMGELSNACDGFISFICTVFQAFCTITQKNFMRSLEIILMTLTKFAICHVSGSTWLLIAQHTRLPVRVFIAFLSNFIHSLLELFTFNVFTWAAQRKMWRRNFLVLWYEGKSRAWKGSTWGASLVNSFTPTSASNNERKCPRVRRSQSFREVFSMLEHFVLWIDKRSFSFPSLPSLQNHFKSV